MQTRTPRALVAAAALALFASACTDVPTAAPAARAPGASASRTTSAGPTLISNSVKYRDEGGKPATGRSGNAELRALALLAKDGTTTLEYSAHHATDYFRHAAISKTQIKAFDAKGGHKFTNNLISPYPMQGRILGMQGLTPGDRLQIQANVEGVDGNRMDVVTVTEPVKRLPDLAVRMSAPAEAATGTPVNVMATVTEQNGDMGTIAVCGLYAGGELLDYAYGIWVDAGDAVTCAMTSSFGTPGTYALEVRVTVLTSADWDSSNNTDTATITVNGPAPRFYTSADFFHSMTADTSVYEGTWRNTQTGQAGESRGEYHYWQAIQHAYLYGSMPARLVGDTDVRISMSTGGRAVHGAEWTVSGSGDPWGWCTDRYDRNITFWMCTGGSAVSGYTTINYAFSSGAVTYHGREYSRTWDELTGEEYVYHWNSGYGWEDNIVTPGEDWTFEVRLNTAGREHVALHVLPLNRFVNEHVRPRECSTWEDPDWGYSSTYCSSWNSRQEHISGFSQSGG